MRWTSLLAIYVLFWAFSVFLVLPFGVKTAEEAGEERIPGQAESAPVRFDLKRHFLKAAAVALVLFAIFYANWAFGWVSASDLDIYHAVCRSC